MTRLDNKVALITGAARGMGRSHAVALAEAGAVVALVDIAAPVPAIEYPLATQEDLDETVSLVEEEGSRALGIVADVRETDQIDSAVARTVKEFGRLDILIANSGVQAFSTVENTSDEVWNTVLNTNLTGIFKSIRAAIPPMRRNGYGRVIAISSMAGRVAYPNFPHYVAAKWGVIGLVKAAAQELSSTGITANVVAPAGVATNMMFNQPTYNVFCPDIENPTREDFERRLADQGSGLNGHSYLEVQHVTRAIMYLLGDEDGIITGQVTEVGLGTSATNTA